MKKLFMAFLFFSFVGVGCLRAMEEADSKEEVLTEREVELFGEEGEGYYDWQEQKRRGKVESMKKNDIRLWLIAAECRRNIGNGKLIAYSFKVWGYKGRDIKGECDPVCFTTKGSDSVVAKTVLDITDNEFACNFIDYSNRQKLELEKDKLMSRDGVYLNFKDVEDPDRNTLLGYLLHKVKNRKEGGGWLYQEIAEQNKEEEENKVKEPNKEEDEEEEAGHFKKLLTAVIGYCQFL